MNKYIAKIEGHGSLDIDWSKNQAKLNVHEGERLFEGILVGRTIEESHWITPRICGVCPIAHNLASLRACEDGLGIKISPATSLLRDLMVCAQMMQSHVLHLFFLSLPDYLGIDRGTELAQKDPRAFKSALEIKMLSDEIATIIAGRNVHPTTTTIGGFHKVPTQKQLKNLLKKIKITRKSAEHALKICLKIKFPELKVDLKFLTIEATLRRSKRGFDGIKEEVRNYSTAKFGSYQGKEMFVGSLARLYYKKTKSPLLDFENPFHNNLAQAMEVLEYHKKAEEILDKLLKSELNVETSDVDRNLSTSDVDRFKGIGAIEAPRGGLYHEIHFNKKGIITYANIITPTVQNLTSIEKSANALLEQQSAKNLSRAKSRKELEQLLNMLVRAYDPCITCSVH